MALDNIQSFFDEGLKLWKIDMDLVLSKHFFELWESVQQPKPFAITGREIELLGNTFELSGEHKKGIGYYTWDDEECCPVLKVEAPDYLDKFLLTFDDGCPRVYDCDPVFHEVEEMGYGESLEVIYDVIAYVNGNFPEWDILELSQKKYLEVLELIKDRHDKYSMAVMKKTSAYHVKKMIKEAARDMALDDLSSQLTLPLGGSYSADQSIGNVEETIEQRIARRTLNSDISNRTKWTVLREMELLSYAGHSATDIEKDLVLRFVDVEILRSNKKGEFSIRLKTDGSAPLREGDKLNLYSRGSRESIGDFFVDLYDGEVVCGRVYADVPVLNDQIYARPRKSPREFLSVSFEELMRQVKSDETEALSPALRSVLGIDHSKHISFISKKAPKHMDDSQNRAWSCATDSKNSVVLIQGPPGTGKTSVLEHVLRTLVKEGRRILISAPSNTAVDNICRRCFDLPVLRFGSQKDSIAPDVADECWIGESRNIAKFTYRRGESDGGGVYAGTHVGILKNNLVREDISQNGMFDAVIFDEAGMARTDEFLLCAQMSNRVILFGDQQQLPPFPLPQEVIQGIDKEHGPLPAHLWALLMKSALEWLVSERQFPIVMMERSYRCQNPRLLRFSSTLFYDAQVKASESAEYYQLSYTERHKKYPAGTLRLFKTSMLGKEQRAERITYEGNKPGLDNPVEATICVNLLYDFLEKYPLDEITIIAPYRRQVKLIREEISKSRVSSLVGKKLSESDWQRFLFTRIATVDSFQGGESDVVMICYVRSNTGKGIGFVDDANRINVAHTRARREMVIVGDLECLKLQARNNIFHRMERACERDGELIEVSPSMLKQLN